jgi:hypothetical protein
MSAQEVIDFFAPSNETVDAVTTWLTSAGVEDITLSENKQVLPSPALLYLALRSPLAVASL